uniref:Potassium voltage-gated channel subfamily E member 3 n=1 Tax=Erpetoichthys calabaricus TaxID=27687 RepID=A0A8C4RUY2_ERPCA
METNEALNDIYERLQHLLTTLNKTLRTIPGKNETEWNPVHSSSSSSSSSKNDYSYIYILFILILFSVTVAGIVLGHTRVKKTDKRQDPYKIYIERKLQPNL